MAETTALAPQEQARLAALDRLSAGDVVEYQKYCDSGKPNLSLDTNKRLYELYVSGLSVDDMLALNTALPRGAVLKARVDGRWDERRDAYLGELLGETAPRLRQMAAESLGFMHLLLSVAMKEHGTKLKRYIQTGDPKDLGDFRITSLGQMKTIFESIARLLDAGKTKGGEGAPLVQVNAGQGASVTVGSADGTGRRFTPEEADAIRQHLDQTGK